jgi:hypothetical protein
MTNQPSDDPWGEHDIPTRVASFRSLARTAGREALECADNGDFVGAQYGATLAIMYFAAAMDADHFGDVPPLLPPGSEGEKSD